MKTQGLIKGLSSEHESAPKEGAASDVDTMPEIAVDFQRKKIERLNEEIADLKQDRAQRKIFSYCIFGFMCLYTVASLVVVFMCGCEVMKLDNSILITLLTTTLANIIGVFNFVAKYLFHSK